MIYVRMEMWPRGDRTRARLLGEGTITNAGGNEAFANYDCVLLKSPEYSKTPGDPAKPTAKTTWKRTSIKGFPRSRLGPWDLLFRCLRMAIGNRNPLLRDPEPCEPG